MNWLQDKVTACASAIAQSGTFRMCFPVANDVDLGGRKLRLLRQLGEGGYSYVYLVRDMADQSLQPAEYALKRIWAVTPEQLEAAKREVDVIKLLSHPNLLQLVDHAIVGRSDEDGVNGSDVYILFPVYLEGSLMDEMDRRVVASNPFTPRQVLDVFLQVCRGVGAMHSMSPALAHRDIKPQNILLSCKNGNGSAAKYSVALTDFGSTRPTVTEVTNRKQAVKLQEDAEAHCTAPYRAPELFDVPSECVVDGRVDVWSLGCVLFYLMAGVSPFEHVLGEAGGSLALAVMNGKVTWPKRMPREYPEGLRALVIKCLEINPAVRPHIHTVILQLEAMETEWSSSGVV